MEMITGRPLLKDEILERFQNMLKVNREYPKMGHFKVALRSGNDFVRYAKLEMTKNGETEIGYVLLPEFWQKGLWDGNSTSIGKYCKSG